MNGFVQPVVHVGARAPPAGRAATQTSPRCDVTALNRSRRRRISAPIAGLRTTAFGCDVRRRAFTVRLSYKPPQRSFWLPARASAENDSEGADQSSNEHGRAAGAPKEGGWLDVGDAWDVPWGLGDLAKWLGWSVLYTVAGAVLVVAPVVSVLAGPAIEEMMQYGALGMPVDSSNLMGGRLESILLVLIYGLQMGAGLLGLRSAITKPFGPLKPSADPFRFDFRDGSFLKWGFGGLLLALPAVNGAALLQALLSAEQQIQPQEITELVVRSAGAGVDGVAIAAVLAVASLLAPAFEEVIFRGLIMTTLAKYIGVWPAIFANGAVFALAHGDGDQLLPLTAAGVVLGYVYARSRNLAASALAHALWNGSTLLLLIALLLLGDPVDLLDKTPV